MTAVTTKALDASSVAEAAAAIGPHIRRTPTEKSDALSGLAGREVYLKLENLQKTGSFKIRGRLNDPMSVGAGLLADSFAPASEMHQWQGVAFTAEPRRASSSGVLPI